VEFSFQTEETLKGHLSLEDGLLSEEGADLFRIGHGLQFTFGKEGLCS
jgi:hypothetical protein